MQKAPRIDKTERKRVLLAAARDVFAREGYHDAKIDDIARVANVAKGTYYLYFKDKRAVMEELVDGLFLRLGGAILRVDPGKNVRAQVEHNVRAIVAVLLDDPAMTRLLLSYAAGLDPAFARKVSSFYDGVRTMLRVALEDGQALGIVAEGDAELYAAFTIGAMKESLYDFVIGARSGSRELVVDELFRFLARGYLRVGTNDSPVIRASRRLRDGAAPTSRSGRTPAPSAEAKPRRASGSRRRRAAPSSGS